ncbi:hypothetical protein Tco_0545828 [Tanacetum coccineum]
MCIDELHKFSDGTLNDVRSALDDILKRIRMKYLPQTVWRNVDNERAGAMIQAIDEHLRNRMIMRSLENFIGGRLYSNPMIQPEPEGSTQGYPLDSVEVLSDKVLKLKNFKKDAILKLFKLTNQERYEHVGPEVPSSQDGKNRLCLVDDLKILKITYSQVKIKEQAKSMIIVRIKGEKKEALHTLRQKPERFDTSAGNPVKEILLKLNLPDHRILKDGHGGTWFQLTHRFIATFSYPTDKHKDIMKAQVHVSRLPLL